MMSVCMKRCGRSNRIVIGAVSRVIGSMRSRRSSTGVPSGNGPTPDDPTIVTCGGVPAASRGSAQRCTSSICSRTGSPSSATTKMPAFMSRKIEQDSASPKIEISAPRSGFSRQLREAPLHPSDRRRAIRSPPDTCPSAACSRSRRSSGSSLTVRISAR